MAVICNPFPGQFVEDLRPLFEAGAMLGERLTARVAEVARWGPQFLMGEGPPDLEPQPQSDRQTSRGGHSPSTHEVGQRVEQLC
jgi:hypothetical protein